MGIEIGVNESQPLEVVFEEISSGIEVSVDENPITVDLQTPPEIQVSINEVCVYENTPITEYNQLHNLPRINNVELLGNKTGSQLGLQNSEFGKGLSSNDFTNSYKNILDTHPIDYNNPHKTNFSNIEGYPSIPTNNRFLRDDKTFAEIVAGSGGYAANVYLTDFNSDISTYKKISYSVEATETIVSTTATNESKLIYNYIYDSGVGVTNLDEGSWDFFFNCKLDGISGNNRIKTIIFKRDISNIETDLITTYSSELINTDYLQIRFQNIQQNIPVLVTDRIGVRVYFETTNTNPVTFSLKIGYGNASYFTTPLALRHSQLRLPNEDVNVQHLTNAEKTQGALATGNVILPTVKDVADAVANMLPKPPEEEDLYSYGVLIDTRVASPILQRVGSSDLGKIQPIVNNFRACILKDDGTINYYLNSSDVTKKLDGSDALLDGTDGQIMIEIPDMWRSIKTIDTYRTEIRFSPYEIIGYEKIEGFYYSPILATVQRSTNKLSSVISTSTDYRGGNNNSSWDALPKTLLGMCATSLSRTQFRNYSQNRGIKYIGSTYYMNEILLQLYWCEYANLNMQDAYIASLTAEGYRQGGLGIGVTTINGTNWNTFNGYYPLTPNGVGFQSVGVNTGIKNYTISGLGVSVDIPVWHGIENIFGHMWQSEDGVNIEIQAADSGALSKAWICKNIRFFADTITSEYACVGNIPRVEGWITQMIKGTILPLAVGGSSNTYYCDYSYTTIPTTGVIIRQVLRGGSASNGSNAGLGYSHSSSVPSYASTNIASRLCAVKSI